MIVSDHDGEITYYEVLGLAPGASPDQIREAFRLLVRLLHPDQQTDPQLKEIAETQMRKLNRIYAVLSDPQKRRRYDEILEDDYSPPIVFNSPSPVLSRWIARTAWGAAIAASAGLLIWLASDSTSIGQGRTPDPTGVLAATSVPVPAFPGKLATGELTQVTELAQLRLDLRTAIVERDAAIHELEGLRGSAQVAKSGASGPSEEQEEKQPLTLTELPTAPKAPGAPNSTSARVERPTNRQLAGFWFYARPPLGQKNKNQALYPPDFIELMITEESGMIRGRLRSRFHIVDRAVYPDVNFTFAGTSNGSQINCLWTGAGGAKGELALKLASENSLRLDWNATELGSQLGLNSGTALLTRRIE